MTFLATINQCTPPAAQAWMDVLYGILLLNLSRSVEPIYFILQFPATVLHELMHYLFALIWGGQPSWPSFWPRRQGQQQVLGSVETRSLNLLNVWPIALAPLILIPIFVLQLPLFPNHPPLLQRCIHAALGVSLLSGSIPSSQDFALIWQHSRWLLLVLLALILAFALLDPLFLHLHLASHLASAL